MILGLERSPGEGNSSTLQYFCLGNPMDKGAWRGEIPSAAKKKKKNNSSIYLCYSWKFPILTAFMQHLLPSLFTSGNHKSDLFFFFFLRVVLDVYFWSIIDRPHYVNSYNVSSLQVSIHFKLTMTSLMICHHTKILLIDISPMPYISYP